MLLLIFLCTLVFGQQSTEAYAIDTSNIETEQSPIRSGKLQRLLFAGLAFQQTDKQRFWYVPSLFELFPANTVEGFVANPQVSFTQHLKDDRLYQLKPRLRYGFGNKRLQADLQAFFYYQPERKAYLQVAGGRTVQSFDKEHTLSAFNNTISTFLQELNYLKIYERSYVELTHSIAPTKSMLLTAGINYSARKTLDNLPRYGENSVYLSNEPSNAEQSQTAFEPHRSLSFHAALRWQKGHQYKWERGELVSVSPYPAITLSYTAANADWLNTDLTYEKIALRLSEDYSATNWGRTQVLLEVGDFLRKEALTFVDVKHFNGNKTTYTSFGIENFQLLDYYQYSTANFYFEGHLEHQLTPISILGGKRELVPVLRVNYLYTATAQSYWELGMGVGKLLNNLRVDVYNSWQQRKHDAIGVRLGFTFD